MCTVHELLALFWNTKFWLPPGMTWKDFEPEDDNDRDYDRLLYLYPIPLTAGILLYRFVFEKYCFRPLGVSLGLNSAKNEKTSTNLMLEKAYASSARWTRQDITALAKQTDYSERQIERWFRLRKSPTLDKFSECCWGCLYHSNLSIYGLVMLWTKPWFWNLDLCWANYPHQVLSNDIWWYYLISLSYNWSLFISHILDTKRKDYWPMCLHHIITIILMWLSWTGKMYRMGCILLIMHDVSDATLYASKTCSYAKCEHKLSNFLFVLFVITWYATKLIYYPFWIMHNALFRSFVVVGLMSHAYYVFNGLLIGLFVMHVYWSYLIFKLITKVIGHGKIKGGDTRDDEDSE